MNVSAPAARTGARERGRAHVRWTCTAWRLTLDTMLVAVVREAVLLVLSVSAPPLLAALVVGLGTGIAQAATQVQDPSIGVVARLAAVLAALGVAGPWIASRVARFAATCLELAHRTTS